MCAVYPAALRILTLHIDQHMMIAHLCAALFGTALETSVDPVFIVRISIMIFPMMNVPKKCYAFRIKHFFPSKTSAYL